MKRKRNEYTLHSVKQVGPFVWGHSEFESWFGVKLPWVHWPLSWAARFDIFDRTIINEGFYGVVHGHP